MILGGDRHQPLVVELRGGFEQDPIMVTCASLRGVRRPRGVAQRGFQLVRMRGFVFLPLAHEPRESELAECAVQVLRERLLERHTVDLRGFVRLDAGHRLALNEQSLARIQRRERMVPIAKVGHRLLDAEQLCDERFKMRCQRDQQLGFGLALERLGVRACLVHTIGESRHSDREMLHEQPVELDQPFAPIQICKFEVEGKRESRWCAGAGERSRGHQRTKRNMDIARRCAQKRGAKYTSQPARIRWRIRL
jgi:hypothetical protein